VFRHLSTSGNAFEMSGWLKAAFVILVATGTATFLISDAHLRRPTTEKQKLAQLVPRMRIEDTEFSRAMQEFVDRLPEALVMQVCKDLADRRISIAADGTTTAEEVLKQIAPQLGSNLQLWGGRHGTVAVPRFECVPRKEPLVFVVPRRLRGAN